MKCIFISVDVIINYTQEVITLSGKLYTCFNTKDKNIRSKKIILLSLFCFSYSRKLFSYIASNIWDKRSEDIRNFKNFDAVISKSRKIYRDLWKYSCLCGWCGRNAYPNRFSNERIWHGKLSRLECQRSLWPAKQNGHCKSLFEIGGSTSMRVSCFIQCNC